MASAHKKEWRSRPFRDMGSLGAPCDRNNRGARMSLILEAEAGDDLVTEKASKIFASYFSEQEALRIRESFQEKKREMSQKLFLDHSEDDIEVVDDTLAILQGLKCLFIVLNSSFVILIFFFFSVISEGVSKGWELPLAGVSAGRIAVSSLETILSSSLSVAPSQGSSGPRHSQTNTAEDVGSQPTGRRKKNFFFKILLWYIF